MHKIETRKQNRISLKGTSKITNYPLKNKMNANTVKIVNGKWQKFEMVYYCQLVKEWKVEALWVYENLNQMIMKEIQLISFPSLKVLSVRKNKINSIEGLCRMQLPSLRQLNLGSNEIMSVHEFRKITFRSLTWIGLYQNRLNEVDSLQGMGFQDRIYSVCLEYGSSLKAVQDLTSVIKLQCCRIQELMIKNRMRIQQKKLKKVLERKYKIINIKEFSQNDDEQA